MKPKLIITAFTLIASLWGSFSVLASCGKTSTLRTQTPTELRLSSPNGLHKVCFFEKQVSPGVNELHYQVSYNGKQVIADSRAGLQLDNRTWELALALQIKQPECWMNNFEVDSICYQPLTDHIWHPLYGERSTTIKAPLCICRKKMAHNTASTLKYALTTKALPSAISFQNIPKQFSIK